MLWRKFNGEVLNEPIYNAVEQAIRREQYADETEKKHTEFVSRMTARGYTERQVRRLVEWYMRVKQAG